MSTTTVTDNEQVNTVTSQPRSRKVSIQTDATSETGYDNLGYESSSKRKQSQQSDNLEQNHHIPSRKRSNLTNGNPNGINSNTESIIANHLNDLNGRQKGVPMSERKQPTQIEKSWIYNFCIRCRGEDVTPSWQPPFWEKCCPFPLCPTFRQFSRLVSIILIGIIVWIAAVFMIGPTAAPGGRLFRLIVLVVVADFGGFLINLTSLPRLIGMLITGIIFQNLGWVEISGELILVTAEVRKFALVIILIRAGLEMDPDAFKKVYFSILKLGLVPWFAEFGIMAVLTHYIVGLEWLMALCLGAIFAAVSPAVVVACLFKLRTKGYGVAKGIPTLIVSISGIDDAASVALFGILSSILFGTGGIPYQISQAPVCVFGGVGFGVVWGYLMRIVPEKGDAYVIPIRALLLCAGGTLAILGSEQFGYEGAGPLGVVFAAFVSNLFWCKQGWTVEDNPVGTAFEIFWMFFEPALFGITGAAVKLDELDAEILYTALAIIAAAVILRILVTIAIAFGDGFNLKEKIFVAFACMAKATVQAALGPVTLRKFHQHGNATGAEIRQAEIILMYCILSIVVTAPLGAIIITFTGPRLLTRTKPMNPDEVTDWRRSHRPSLYDISIIDEKEEREDPEMQIDGKTQENTNTNANKLYMITKL